LSKAGRVISVQGPVVDVRFDDGAKIPNLYDAVETKTHDGRRVVLEVAEHHDAPGRMRPHHLVDPPPHLLGLGAGELHAVQLQAGLYAQMKVPQD